MKIVKTQSHRPAKAKIAASWMTGAALSLVLLLPAGLHAGTGDSAWYDQQEFLKRFPPVYEGDVRTSRYLTMRDGCRIAVDVHLPEGLEANKRIPTMIHQTRYWRSIVHNPPFDRLLQSGRMEDVRDFFVRRGYAWVAADVRGTGASFGYRPCEYSRDEIADGRDIIDWVIRQPWSDGTVGATGVSYDGGTTEFLATHRHPAVKAVAPLFSMFDPYLETVFPGGIHMVWMTRTWGALTSQLDRNELPDILRDKYGKLLKLTGSSVRPVDDDADRSTLKAAVASHAYNWDLHETLKRAIFRDDKVPYDWTLGFDTLSPYLRAKDVDASGVAVYSYSGWYDAGFAHAAIKRHMTLTGRKNRLTIGPWNHGGRHDSSPYSTGHARFDQRVELFRFFEHHLRRAETGIAGEKPIHYFVMGAERWRQADSWPPAATPRTFYLGANNRLVTTKPTDAKADDRYRVDRSHGTGSTSRWDCLVMGGNVVYPDRAEQDAKLLCYDTAPLPEDLEVTGHPIVTLHITTAFRDGNVLAYLEDVKADGAVHLISEGMLHAVHRKLSNERPPYRTVVPYRTYRRSDAMPLVPGEPAVLTFDLLPTSYVFKARHRIRIAIAGADVDHFANPPGPPRTFNIHRSANCASHIVLPIVASP